MLKIIRQIFITLLIFSVLGIVAWQGIRYYVNLNVHSEEQSVILLEKIRTVCKLITVEGYFSEVYDYKDYRMYDIGFLRKKALIRVKAKVSVGYDLSNIFLEADNKNRLIVLSELPEPEILSIDHDLDYYDVSEGTFNSFSASDYTELSKRAKSFIEKKALDSELVSKADEQKKEVLDLVRFMVQNAGWELKITGIGKIPADPGRLPDLSD